MMIIVAIIAIKIMTKKKTVMTIIVRTVKVKNISTNNVKYNYTDLTFKNQLKNQKTIIQ